MCRDFRSFLWINDAIWRPLSRFITALSATFLVIVFTATSSGQEPDSVSFTHHVRPILQAKCFGCHQDANDEGDYVMTEFSRLVAGGESEEDAIVAGSAVDSYLVYMITPDENGDAQMPPDGEKLTAKEIEQICAWIDQGAVDDSPPGTATSYSRENPPTYSSRPVISALDYSADGKWLAVSGFHEVLLFEIDSSSATPGSTD